VEIKISTITGDMIHPVDLSVTGPMLPWFLSSSHLLSTQFLSISCGSFRDSGSDKTSSGGEKACEGQSE
jgi:hypothetical protein